MADRMNLGWTDHFWVGTWATTILPDHVLTLFENWMISWFDVTWYKITWYDMTLYKTTWHDMIRHDMLQDSMIWDDIIQDNMIWHDMRWYTITWYDMTWYNMIWHDMTWHHDTIWHNTAYTIYHDMINDMTWYHDPNLYMPPFLPNISARKSKHIYSISGHIFHAWALQRCSTGNGWWDPNHFAFWLLPAGHPWAPWSNGRENRSINRRVFVFCHVFFCGNSRIVSLNFLATRKQKGNRNWNQDQKKYSEYPLWILQNRRLFDSLLGFGVLLKSEF